MESCEVLVVGGGMAGVSAAAEIGRTRSVIVLEQEDAPGRHATGRSAASFGRGYGNAAIRALTELSFPFMAEPEPDFAEAPLLRPRDWLITARSDQLDMLGRMAEALPAAQRVDAATAERLCPILRPGYVAEALQIADSPDIDVDGLLQGYLRLLRRRGGRLAANARALGLARENGAWIVETAQGAFRAPVLVNAAGAWADAVAALAGLPPLGLLVLKRTAALVDAPEGVDPTAWALVLDVDEEFYFKPDAGKILISPADETPAEPGEAYPDEFDVAVAADRFEQATTVQVRRINHSWAGLRTFAPDRTPVLGFDPGADGFFWLAGQGGYGIQTAPGMALAAAQELGAGPAVVSEALTAAMSPRRLVEAA